MAIVWSEGLHLRTARPDSQHPPATCSRCSRRTQDRRRLYAAAQLEVLHDHKNQRPGNIQVDLDALVAGEQGELPTIELLANLNIDFIGSAGDERQFDRMH